MNETNTRHITTGYKVFNEDWTCRGKQYECPGEFEEDVTLSLCERGMHFCKNLKDCFFYYMLSPSVHIAKVFTKEYVLLDSKSSKCCTDKLNIVREIFFEEAMDILYIEWAASFMENNLYKSLYDFEEAFNLNLFKEIKTSTDNINQFIVLLNNNYNFKNLCNKYKHINSTNTIINVHLEPIIDNIAFFLSDKINNELNSQNAFIFSDSLSLFLTLFNQENCTIDDWIKRYTEHILEGLRSFYYA